MAEPPEREGPIWVPTLVVMAAHYEQLREHGGLHGVRDRNVLESALNRPRNRHAYDPDADVADLAAAYAFGLLTSHPFTDGNKRAGYVTASIFLELNGYGLAHDDEEIVRVMLAVAAGEITEPDVAAWFRRALQPVGD